MDRIENVKMMQDTLECYEHCMNMYQCGELKENSVFKKHCEFIKRSCMNGCKNNLAYMLDSFRTNKKV